MFSWYYRGVVYQEFLLQGSTIDKNDDLEVMRRLQYEENVRSCVKTIYGFYIKIMHLPMLIKECLAKNNTIFLLQASLPPCDFFLLPKLKTPMKGQRFTTIEEIKTAFLKELKATPESALKIGKNVV